MLESIQKLITEEDNKMLNKAFTTKEIKNALFSMNPNNSPEPDGFQAFLFQNAGIY